MQKKIRILGIIPARGGSKSISKKNIAIVAGKPLIYYTIREAKKSRMLDALIVSTDSEEIADVAKKYGVDVPFLRPNNISRDTSPDIDFMRHALEWLRKNRGWKPEILVNLRPTSPLRTAKDIDRAVKLAIANHCSLVKTVSSPDPHNPFKMWLLDEKKSAMRPLLPTKSYRKLGTDVPRQKLPRLYWQNGLVDVVRVKELKRGTTFRGKICGIVTEPERSVDIDSPSDLKKLAALLDK